VRIGFDFDRVLFRTDEFKEHLEEEIPGFLETYPSEGVYDPQEHAEKLGIDPERIEQALEDAERFLYEDVQDLEKLESFDLVIVSRGDESFQRKKIESSGARKYFDEIFIVQERDKDVGDIDLLADDTAEELQRVEVHGVKVDRSREDMSGIIERIKEKLEEQE